MLSINKFKSIKECYDAVKPSVSYVTFFKRIKRGESIEQAARPPGKAGKPEGAKALPAPEFLREYGETLSQVYRTLRPPMTYQTFRQRAVRCSSVAEIMAPKAPSGRKLKVVKLMEGP